MLISNTAFAALLFMLVDARSKEFHGLIGLGAQLYDLPCGTACYEAIAFNPLACTPKSSHSHAHSKEPTTPSSCFATDKSYLTSLAWCMKQRCSGVETWKIEKFWNQHAISKKIFPVPPVPVWTYQESLQHINEMPTETMEKETLLNTTMNVNGQRYKLAWRATTGRQAMEVAHSKAA
jgi:hypothetical protein